MFDRQTYNMPQSGTGKRRRRSTRSKQKGKGVMDVLKKINNFARKTKIVSNVANVLGQAGVPYASKISSTASKMGYGRVVHIKSG